MNISQSLMNDVFDKPCPRQIKFKYVDRIKTDPTDLMMRGHYFEYLILGSTTGTPELPKLAKGGKSQAEKDIDALADYAKGVIKLLNVEFVEPQRRLEADGLSGIVDAIAVRDKSRFILDLKYTETKYDDRWNGWADFETMPKQKRQARHYIYLWYKLTGEWLPYYFFVFGKSGWSRIIQCVVTKDSIGIHEREIETVRDMLYGWEASEYPATPSYTKCNNCPFMDRCDSVQVIPDIEKFIV